MASRAVRHATQWLIYKTSTCATKQSCRTVSQYIRGTMHFTPLLIIAVCGILDSRATSVPNRSNTRGIDYMDTNAIDAEAQEGMNVLLATCCQLCLIIQVKKIHLTSRTRPMIPKKNHYIQVHEAAIHNMNTMYYTFLQNLHQCLLRQAFTIRMHLTVH